MMGISPVNLLLTPLYFSPSQQTADSPLPISVIVFDFVFGFLSLISEQNLTKLTFERTEVFPSPLLASCHNSRQNCLERDTGGNEGLRLGAGGEIRTGMGQEGRISPGEAEAELMRSICRQAFERRPREVMNCKNVLCS